MPCGLRWLGVPWDCPDENLKYTSSVPGDGGCGFCEQGEVGSLPLPSPDPCSKNSCLDYSLAPPGTITFCPVVRFTA